MHLSVLEKAREVDLMYTMLTDRLFPSSVQFLTMKNRPLLSVSFFTSGIKKSTYELLSSSYISVLTRSKTNHSKSAQ